VVALSWAAAIVTCVGYGVGSMLQAVGARRVARAAGVGGLAAILVQLPYLAGLAVDVVAFVANVVALRRLPLFLVQSFVTASVGVTAVLAALSGERLRPRDWGALAVLGAGLVMLGATATAEAGVALSRPVQYAVLVSAVLPVGVGLLGLRLRPRPASLVLAAAAGLAWTGVAVAARGIGADALGWGLLAQPLAWVVVVQGVVGTAFFALALQRGPVTPITAVTFTLEMVVPSLLGLWLLGDGVSPGDQPWAVLGFVLALAGTVALTRFAEPT
jgi:hypothetical protein